MSKTICRAVVALIITLGAIGFQLTRTNVSTAKIKGRTADPNVAIPKPTPRLMCARGVKISGGYGVVVDITLAVQEGEDAGEIARDALARAGVRPISEKGPSGDFALTGIRWARFFDRDRKNNLVEQVYNPDGQNFPDAADAAANSAGQTWAGVPTATFADAVQGTTSDPTIGFDGVNKIAWPSVWVQSARALAVTLTTFDIATGFILDADVTFNRSFAFSLNPQPGDGTFDFQRVMLHEDGHVAGLDHSLDPNAVMFAALGPGPYSHALTQDDIDGISTIYPLKFTALPNPHKQSGGSAPALKVIARLGDPAPGGFIYDFDFEPYALSDSGQVAFAADFFDPNSFASGEGAFLNDGTTTQVLAKTGDPAPGGGIFGLGVWVNIGLNERGDAAFAFALDPFIHPAGLNSGVYRWDASSQSLSAVVAPFVTPAPTGGPFLGAYTHATLDQRGQVAFAGIIPTDAGTTPGLGMGVFLAHTDGVIEKVAAPGDPAPGSSVFDFADTPALNASGTIVFSGHVRGEECLTSLPQTVAIHCDQSLYLRRPDGSMVSLVHAGDPAPGGGTFRSAFEPVINSRGDVLFRGDLTPPPDRGLATGFFLWRDGQVIAIARPGQEMPGGGNLVRTAFQHGNWTMNDSGDVAFSALLDSDSLGLGDFDMGLYVWSSGSLRLVARTGMDFPGLGTLIKLSPPLFFGEPFSGALIDGRGEVVFQGTFQIPVSSQPNTIAALLKVDKRQGSQR
jgi:hypothetical protein